MIPLILTGKFAEDGFLSLEIKRQGWLLNAEKMNFSNRILQNRLEQLFVIKTDTIFLRESLQKETMDMFFPFLHRNEKVFKMEFENDSVTALIRMIEKHIDTQIKLFQNIKNAPKLFSDATL